MVSVGNATKLVLKLLRDCFLITQLLSCARDCKNRKTKRIGVLSFVFIWYILFATIQILTHSYRKKKKKIKIFTSILTAAAVTVFNLVNTVDNKLTPFG